MDHLYHSNMYRLPEGTCQSEWSFFEKYRTTHYPFGRPSQIPKGYPVESSMKITSIWWSIPSIHNHWSSWSSWFTLEFPWFFHFFSMVFPWFFHIFVCQVSSSSARPSPPMLGATKPRPCGWRSNGWPHGRRAVLSRNGNSYGQNWGGRAV